jgi:hypothetical protein
VTLAVGTGYLVALVWSYWISTLPLSFQVPHSAARVVLPLGLIAVAAVLHLSAPAIVGVMAEGAPA